MICLAFLLGLIMWPVTKLYVICSVYPWQQIPCTVQLFPTDTCAWHLQEKRFLWDWNALAGRACIVAISLSCECPDRSVSAWSIRFGALRLQPGLSRYKRYGGDIHKYGCSAELNDFIDRIVHNCVLFTRLLWFLLWHWEWWQTHVL